jgi:hypothetical protein
MECSPLLTEPGMHYFMRETLKQCRSRKTIIYTRIYNLLLLLAFFLILGIFLYYKYKGRLTPEEKKKKSLNQEKYILEKIKATRSKTKKHQNLIITDLPTLNSDANLKRFA